MTKKVDIHQQVTDRFIAALEAGTKPWECDWLSFLPKRSNKADYRGMNILLLSMSAAAQGFKNPHWMTYKQAQEFGGTVRKGEKSTKIILFKQAMVDAKDGDSRADENGKRKVSFMRQYSVFNVEQIDDLPDGKFPMPEKTLSDDMRDAVAEEALRSSGATIREGGNAAYYTNEIDIVQMPDFAMFKTIGGYLATLAHELTHWTGHKDRLARPEMITYHRNKKDRAKEELVAEIGAAFICARLGIAGDHFESHAAYVASWLKHLKDDNRAIFKAASQAQTAADMVLKNAELDLAAPEPVIVDEKPEPTKEQAQYEMTAMFTDLVAETQQAA